MVAVLDQALSGQRGKLQEGSGHATASCLRRRHNVQRQSNKVFLKKTVFKSLSHGNSSALGNSKQESTLTHVLPLPYDHILAWAEQEGRGQCELVRDVEGKAVRSHIQLECSTL